MTPGLFSRKFPPSERVNDHEYDLVERRFLAWTTIIEVSKCCLSGYERLVGKEARGKDENRNWDEEVREGQQRLENLARHCRLSRGKFNASSRS